MVATTPGTPRVWPPWLVWGIVLVVISTTELALMFALPEILPERPSRALESTVDSVLLTAVLSPILWWVIARPLQQAAGLRERFLADLFVSMEQERRRIAVELHDGVGQSLTLLVSGLRVLKDYPVDPEVARRASDLRDLADRALKDAKHLSQSLRPSLLDDLGLAPAIERIAADVRDNNPVRVSVEVEALSGCRLPEAVETALFRICQEALANVVRHSGASQATIRFDLEPRAVVLKVSDNGRGIDPRRVQQAADGHIGLSGMRERAALLGGRLSIDSAVGRGTRISAWIPVELAHRAQDSSHAR
jgi:signal transduction histidine kinase